VWTASKRTDEANPVYTPINIRENSKRASGQRTKSRSLVEKGDARGPHSNRRGDRARAICGEQYRYAAVDGVGLQHLRTRRCSGAALAWRVSIPVDARVARAIWSCDQWFGHGQVEYMEKGAMAAPDRRERSRAAHFCWVAIMTGHPPDGGVGRDRARPQSLSRGPGH